MTGDGRKLRSLGVTAALALALLAACATPARQWRATAPAPCTDSTYVQLKRLHPDSISERSWQRLQSLDRECAAARADEAASGSTGSDHGGWMGMGTRHRAMIGAGIMTAVMAAMMITMW